MASKLKVMINRLRALTPDVMREETLKSLRRHRVTANSMNTDQLFNGELANGEKMPEYSNTSVVKFGKEPGPYTLMDTGNFYKGWIFNATKFPAFFESKDLKAGKIADLLLAKGKNPDEVYGLNKENLKELARDFVLPDLQKVVRKAVRVS